MILFLPQAFYINLVKCISDFEASVTFLKNLNKAQ